MSDIEEEVGKFTESHGLDAINLYMETAPAKCH